MRLVTVASADGSRPGALVDDLVVDLSAAFSGVFDVVSGGPAALEKAAELVDRRADVVALDRVELLAPLPWPRRNIFCTGWNYVQHFAEGDAGSQGQVDFPENPTFFTKLPSTVIGPGAPIPVDAALSERMDYEAELAVVIGSAGRNIPVDRALEHVFGYTAANDVSARDVQRMHGGQWFRGKSLERTCPMGPALVTADEVPDPQALDVSCDVNGEARQGASTATMAFDVATLIAELSRGLTLVPGDILLTGTPSGVGYARTPAQFLRPGDEVVVSISGIGRLSNPVVAEDLSSYWHEAR